ncbi:MAG TPA: hypothetical protein VJH22_06735 [Candidatus Nanoarchaeia archaeon]|nr:hypothetical protein [Candidatus Nanoarchaeia archaeon]
MVDRDKAQAIYARIREQLVGQDGKIIAIEVDSGEFFLGRDTGEACEKARERFPDKQFYFLRVGARATYYIGGFAI